MHGVRSFSVRKQLAGASVLLTGAVGYVGSLVLEQLLRCTPVETVFVLVRDKRTCSAETRVRRLLHSGLFNLVRDRPELLAKVCLVKGDLRSLHYDTSTGHAAPKPSVLNSGDVELGQLPSAAAPVWDAEGQRVRSATLADLTRLEPHQRVIIIHCAARIALEDPLQITLSHNYQGTRQLLVFANSLPCMVSFVYVSSAYVNTMKQFLPEGCVHEQMYPVMFGSHKASHTEVFNHVMSLDNDLAEARCKYLCNLWGFPNSYCIAKHLTEQLVYEFHNPNTLPVAIVRPSLVGALQGKPYPGYVGNLAGPSGAALAWILGFFGHYAVALTDWNHLDCVPGETTSSLIIAAAATLVTDCHQPHLPATSSPAAPFTQATAQGESHPEECVHTMPWAGIARSVVADKPADDVSDDQNGHDPSAPSQQADGAATSTAATTNVPIIFHAATSCLKPISHHEVSKLAEAFYRKHPVGVIKLGRNLRTKPGRKLTPWKTRVAQHWLAIKVGTVCSVLRCFGQHKPATRLKQGHTNFVQQVETAKNDHRIFFDLTNAIALESIIPADEQDDFPVVWRGDWISYAHTYMAAVVKLFLSKPVPEPRDHGFVYIPDRRVV